MKHRAHADFGAVYRGLPPEVQELADRCFEFLKSDPRHPSLRLKKVGEYWSARIGLHHRAVALEVEEGLLWVWIGAHDDYERFIG